MIDARRQIQEPIKVTADVLSRVTSYLYLHKESGYEAETKTKI